jgi:5-methylcytosine-specific restriction endonuclease McrA
VPRKVCICGRPALPGKSRCELHPRIPTSNQQRPYRGSAAYKRLRPIVLERDGYRCHLCGRSDPPADEIDHVVPYSKMIPEHRDELRADDFAASHRSCNRRRGAKPLTPPPDPQPRRRRLTDPKVPRR